MANITMQLFGLLERPGNECCADCQSPSPRWASSSLGIFLCVNCVGIHRSLGVQISITKSLELDKWTTEMYQFMESMGNRRSNEIYTKNVPICWKQPTPNTHCLDFYMEEWIRAKYDQKEFMEGNSSKQTYCEGAKDGELKKKDRNGKNWNPRYFRLSAVTGSLSYYNKKEDLRPIKRLDIKQINVILCVKDKTDKHNSMEIIFPEERERNGKQMVSRSIFVHSDTAREIVEWYLSIRSARLTALNLNPAYSEVSMILSSDHIKEGALKKSGPKENDRFILRWVTIDVNKFSYYENKMDATPKNEVMLSSAPGYSVSEGVNGRHPEEPHQFMVSTPERVYNFSADSKEEMEGWIKAFQEAIESEPIEANQFRFVA